MHALHDESGHRGQEATYHKVADRYWWLKLYPDMKRYVAACLNCQRWAKRRQEEAPYPTWSFRLWLKIDLDIAHMPNWKGFVRPRESEDPEGCGIRVLPQDEWHNRERLLVCCWRPCESESLRHRELSIKSICCLMG